MHPLHQPLPRQRGPSVLVRVRGRDASLEAAGRAPFLLHDEPRGTTTLSCSGVWADALGEGEGPGRGTVLCLASSLSPLLRASPPPAIEAFAGGRWRTAALVGVLPLPGVRAAIGRLSDGGGSPWYVGWTPPKGAGLPPPDPASVAVLSVPGAPRSPARHTSPRAAPPVPGEALAVHASPYGCMAPSVLRESVSAGVVSNVVSRALLVSDARVLPGSEGGAVLDAQGRLLGMLTLPLAHESSPVEFNLVITAAALADGLRGWRGGGEGGAQALPLFRSPPPTPPPKAVPAEAAAVMDARRSVVCVRVGASWASGIVVSPNGQVLTNAHLLLPHCAAGASEPSCAVQVRLAGSAAWERARVVFLSRGPWDVALLRLCSPPARPLRAVCLPPDAAYRAGTAVTVVGHGVFPPRAGLDATVTAGTLSRVVRAGACGRPLLLQSSAAVHRGNSGGGIFDAADGSWLGMVTSNVRHSSSSSPSPSHPSPGEQSVIMPRLNLSIPAAVLAPVLRYAGGSGAIGCVRDAMERPKDATEVARLWALDEPGEDVNGGGGGAEDAPPVPARLGELVRQLESRL